MWMTGYVAGISDADEIQYCPFCGEEISSRWSDGSADCDRCRVRFSVIKKEEEE